MDYKSITDLGRVRNDNEDYHIAEEIGKGYFLAAVADGMGGPRAGKVASRLLLKNVLSYMKEGIKDLSQRAPDAARDSGRFQLKGAMKRIKGEHKSFSRLEDIKPLFQEVLQKSIKDVYVQSQEPEFKGMGTTLVAALLKGKDAFIVNIGDSRAYHFNGTLEQITIDHSRVQELLGAGEISEEEAFNHPEKNIVTRYVGWGEKVEYDVFDSEIEGILLLCSDGLTGTLRDKEIEEIMKRGESLEKTAEMLVDAANEKGGEDNITVVLMKP